MKKNKFPLQLFMFFFLISNVNANSQTNLNTLNNKDSIIISCKYDFVWQKDSLNNLSKFNDIMFLDITKERSIFYSYLKQLGNKNLAEDINNQRSLSYGVNNSGRYFGDNESEIITTDLLSRKINIKDKLSTKCYSYNPTVDSLNWEILSDTLTILNQHCQKAILEYKGRNYTAWFCPSIPISAGPWRFNGLPGLILRVVDSKDNFFFNCTKITRQNELGFSFSPYQNCQESTEKIILDKRRLKAQDRIAFLSLEDGVTVRIVSSSGSELSDANQKRILKPYNPIILAEK